jgi:hypothetical protein
MFSKHLTIDRSHDHRTNKDEQSNADHPPGDMTVSEVRMDAVYDLRTKVRSDDNIFVENIHQHRQAGNIVDCDTSEFDIPGNLEHTKGQDKQDRIVISIPMQQSPREK